MNKTNALSWAKQLVGFAACVFLVAPAKAHVLSSSEFSKKLYEAFVDEGQPVKGGFNFANAFTCTKSKKTYTCTLNAAAWETPDEGSMKNVMFTPMQDKQNSLDFDLYEYMKVTAEETKSDGGIVVKKEIEVLAPQNENEPFQRASALTCIVVNLESGKQLLPPQCVLYDNAFKF